MGSRSQRHSPHLADPSAGREAALRAGRPCICGPKRSLSGLLILFFSGVGAVRAESLFSNPIYDLPAKSTFILSADLSQDNRPDLIAASSGRILVWLGLPEGKLGPPVVWSTASGQASVAIGDFNGDAIPDLAQPSTDPQAGAQVLFGRGGGTFGAARFLSISGSHQNDSIATGDLNGDGKDDLAVGSKALGKIWIALSRGEGSFDSPALLSSGVFGDSLAIVDLNGDGKRDLITADTLAAPPAQPSQPGFIRVFPGLGDGRFGAPISTGVGIFPVSLAVADLNHDGKQDVVVANCFSNDVSILLGQGNGALAPQPSVLIQGSSGPQSVLAQDLDGDGHPDLAVGAGRMPQPPIIPSLQSLTSQNPEEDISLFRGRGDGSFEAPTMSRSWGEASDLAIGDFDGDSRPDLTALNSDLTIVLLLSNGDGTFGKDSDRVSFGAGALLSSLNTADFNRDGMADLATLNYPLPGQLGGIHVRLGLGNGTFDPTERVTVLQSSTSYLLPPNAVGDFDGDGDSDLVLLDRSFGRLAVTILLGNGDGTFTRYGSYSVPGRPLAVAIADFDYDMIQDLAVATNDSVVTVVKGIGDGTFTQVSTFPVNTVPLEHGMAAADFNGDNYMDLVMVPWVLSFPRPGPAYVAVLLGHGDGTFAQPTLLPAGFSPRWPLVADFNGDGTSDLAVADAATVSGASISMGVGVHISRGDGTFEPPVWSHLNPAPEFLAAGDFDGDGKLDMAVGKESGSRETSILIGRGDGSFRPPLGFGGYYPSFMVTADFNRDGRTDLAGVDSPFRETAGARVLLAMPPGPRHGPDADTGGNRQAECGARLDGSASSDPDSTPGSNDDILGFDWFEGVMDGVSPTFLARGELADANLPPGEHHIRLIVTDRLGETDSEDFLLTIVDNTAPQLAVSLSPRVLSPPNHKLMPVHATVSAEDRCGGVALVLESISSSEPDDSPGGGDGNTTGDIREAQYGTADLDFLLRSERLRPGPGRIYVIRYRATDDAGNTTLASATVAVPGTP
ncbi:MAG TPA: VCBS repeat-containing protein [Candidatus Polarisedimenticolia bacterium]|nr:VCBS repeat-containing protein [Candidatus Polarisedimenticolia bacterium]